MTWGDPVPTREPEERRVCIKHLRLEVCRKCTNSKSNDDNWTTDVDWVRIAEDYHRGTFEVTVPIARKDCEAVYWRWLWQKASNAVLGLQGDLDSARIRNAELEKDNARLTQELLDIRFNALTHLRRLEREGHELD